MDIVTFLNLIREADQAGKAGNYEEAFVILQTCAENHDLNAAQKATLEKRKAFFVQQQKHALVLADQERQSSRNRLVQSQEKSVPLAADNKEELKSYIAPSREKSQTQDQEQDEEEVLVAVLTLDSEAEEEAPLETATIKPDPRAAARKEERGRKVSAKVSDFSSEEQKFKRRYEWLFVLGPLLVLIGLFFIVLSEEKDDYVIKLFPKPSFSGIEVNDYFEAQVKKLEEQHHQPAVFAQGEQVRFNDLGLELFGKEDRVKKIKLSFSRLEKSPEQKKPWKLMLPRREKAIPLPLDLASLQEKLQAEKLQFILHPKIALNDLQRRKYHGSIFLELLLDKDSKLRFTFDSEEQLRSIDYGQ